MARITAIHLGSDGLTSVVDFRTTTTALRHPIAKVIRLQDKDWGPFACLAKMGGMLRIQHRNARRRERFSFSGHRLHAWESRATQRSPRQLYHPSNYQAHLWPIATSAGISSCATARETAATFCTRRGTTVIASKLHFLHTKALSMNWIFSPRSTLLLNVSSEMLCVLIFYYYRITMDHNINWKMYRSTYCNIKL